MPKVRPASPKLQQLLRNATLLWRRWRSHSTSTELLARFEFIVCPTAILHQPDCKYATSRIVQLRGSPDCATPHALPMIACRPLGNPMNFKLTLNVFKGKKIPKSHPHGTSDKPLSVYNGKKISKFPPPWNLELTLNVYTSKKISNFPPPWNFNLTFECAMVGRYQNSHPNEASNWPSVCTTVRRYQNFHPHGPSNWPLRGCNGN